MTFHQPNNFRLVRNVRASFYSLLIKENKNKPWFLFSPGARLTESHSSTHPSIPVTLRSNDFMAFFTNKYITVREKIHHLLPMNSTDTLSSTESLEPPVVPDFLFTPLFKYVFPLFDSSLLNQINLNQLHTTGL